MLQWCLIQHAGLLPQAAASLSPVRRILTPIIGAAFAAAILWAVRRWRDPGPVLEYVEAVRHHHGVIPFAPTLWRTLSSAFSIATGAAIGREGSMIQFSSAIISWLGRHSPFRYVSLAQQVSYGAAAAVAAAYQAPIAGLFFAVEIVLGALHWDDMPALACASASGWLVSRLILGAGPLFLYIQCPHGAQKRYGQFRWLGCLAASVQHTSGFFTACISSAGGQAPCSGRGSS
jgi:CIC family chloride channel protein